MARRKSSATQSELENQTAAEPDTRPEAANQPSNDEPAKPIKFNDMPRRAVFGFPGIVTLTDDGKTGAFRLKFDDEIIAKLTQSFFKEKIKPLLDELHTTKEGPDLRFQWYDRGKRENAENDWKMYYFFVHFGEDGKPVKNAEGKTEVTRTYSQAHVLAHRITEKIGRMIRSELGIAHDAPIPD